LVKKAEALRDRMKIKEGYRPAGVPLMGQNYERPIHSPLEILPSLYKAKSIKGQPNPDKLKGFLNDLCMNYRHNTYETFKSPVFFLSTFRFDVFRQFHPLNYAPRGFSLLPSHPH
jgi:hypothetical protein